MTIFDLDRAIIHDYEQFSRSFVEIRAPDLLQAVDTAYDAGRFWPEPMIQLNPRFKSGDSVGRLVNQGELHPGCAAIFRNERAPADAEDRSLTLHRHQVDALTKARDGRSFVVTTGTGSGKSLCYFLPIIDRVLRARAQGEPRRTRAIVVYPMNALANSQLEEVNKRLRGSGQEEAVTVALYTGQEDAARRAKIEATPPDILLTNFMMLELLLTRREPRDQAILGHCQDLEFLVLDELHTYRGRQGADVAMLVRRVRERLAASDRPPLCIGTSATMASDAGADSHEQIAKVASLLFATRLDADDIVIETLERATRLSVPPHGLAKPALAAAVLAFDPAKAADEQLEHNPFMVWIELTLGLAEEAGRLRRAVPCDLNQAAVKLSQASGLLREQCRERLQLALETVGRPGRERGGSGDKPFFPVRLHRFISGAGRLFATIEPVGQRTATLDEQIFLPGRPMQTRLYPTYFCRSCGQEHHPVRLVEDGQGALFLARAIDDVPPNDDEQAPADDAPSEIAGFLTPVTNDGIAAFGDAIEQYPEEWQEETRAGERRLKPSYRRSRLVRHVVAPDGRVGGVGARAWFQRGRFRLCAGCGDVRTAGRDINRLAGLTAEGRSSATTVLVGAMLRWIKEPTQRRPLERQKLLGFSDNRQDAALQAGHFNDFVFVSLLRSAVLAALDQAGPAGLADAVVGRRLTEALGFDGRQGERAREWLSDPDLDGRAREDALSDLAAMLAHRFWHDQRQGWRHTFPNLEQLGMITVRYGHLAELCAEDRRFEADLAPLAGLSPSKREEAFRVLLDGARRGLAIRTDALNRPHLEELVRRRQRLLPPWGLDDHEKPREASVLVIGRPPSHKLSEAESYVRTGPQSAIGRALRATTGCRLKAAEHETLLLAMARALQRIGLLATARINGEAHAFQLAIEAVTFHAGDHTSAKSNAYFRTIYLGLAKALMDGGGLLFGIEAREHTAQVEQDRRKIREARFRWGAKEQAELAQERPKLRQLGEPERFLPVMFCSPTMELGVDIAELDIVYLRNVPPSPANYAQRSGRAGRSGSPALVLTYCSAQSPHDQYFFERRPDMIQGIVCPPAIDLANQDLIESHLNAIWLAALRRAIAMATPMKASRCCSARSGEARHRSPCRRWAACSPAAPPASCRTARSPTPGSTRRSSAWPGCAGRPASCASTGGTWRPKSWARSMRASWSCRRASMVLPASRSSRCVAMSARPPPATTRRTAWSRRCWTRPWTRCLTRPWPARRGRRRSRRCSPCASSIPPAAPAISCSRPRGAWRLGWPSWPAPARLARRTSGTGCARRRGAACSASIATRWRSSSPRSPCGSKPSSRASRSPSSMPISAVATACSASMISRRCRQAFRTRPTSP